MARSDLLTSLVKFGISGETSKFRKVVQAIIAEERAKQHRVLAEKLEGLLRDTYSSISSRNLLFDDRTSSLLSEIVPKRKLEDLILSNEAKSICEELVEEHHRSDLLRSYNLEPRNRLLLIGPPGNGKTSFAEALSEALMVPLLSVRYEGIVGTYLGETAVRLKCLIDYACTKKCVLFFDEFETLGKERGDIHETGEIKRVVSSLLMQIDSLPSHVVVVGATNHDELLDRAVWRRFQVRLNLPNPSQAQICEWFKVFERRISVPLGYAPITLAKKLSENSFAEIEEFGTTVFRKYVLKKPNADMRSIVKNTLKQWNKRASYKNQQNKEVSHA